MEAPDLPGHGTDKTLIQEVTLQSCVDKVCSIIETHSKPVILVGHSLAGLVVSQVAEQIPEKVRLSVYLTADLLADGESLLSEFEQCRQFIDISRDQSHFTVKNGAVAKLFYNDCSPDDIAKAKKLLCPEATVMFKTPVHLSRERYGRVPRIYIECLRDRTHLPSYQKAMYTASPCLRVFSLDTSHSPFLSAPEQLANCLLSLAG